MDDPRTPAEQPRGVPDSGPGTSIEPEAEPAEPATAAPAEAAPTEAAPADSAPPKRRSPLYLRGRRLRLPRSRRGIFALLLILAGFGFAGTFTAVSLLQWTETADFCGRCHTMSPELAAYEMGPHRDVACAECHVEPGIAGWVKAKINGTKQLVDVILGTFPAPIPPPDHTDLPSSSDTCKRCHDVSSLAVTTLKTRTEYAEDEKNTREFIGLMLRPGGGNPFDVQRSVHWHVLRNVTYASADPRANSVDYVAATAEDGSIQEYIAQGRITDSSNVRPDIAAIKASDRLTTMSCYDCHNRVGHSIPNPRTGLDAALSTGTVDPSLPYIKREGMHVLVASYADLSDADAAADRLTDFYAQNYPAVAKQDAAEISAAIAEIKVLYRLTATPEMQVTAKTYPDHLGHTDFPGCFRCHDGGHYLVVDGVATKTIIPSTCDTCHTFPQIGPAVASLPLGEPPATHRQSLWVFNHKGVATSLDPGGQSCGECHARDYCVNCHSTGAVTVDHEEMATNHAAIIRKQGNTACAYCHQPPYCARCHSEPVLPITTPFLQGALQPAGRDTAGVSWPLHVQSGG